MNSWKTSFEGDLLKSSPSCEEGRRLTDGNPASSHERAVGDGPVAVGGVEKREEVGAEGGNFSSDGVGEGDVEGLEGQGCRVEEARGGETGLGREGFESDREGLDLREGEKRVDTGEGRRVL